MNNKVQETFRKLCEAEKLNSEELRRLLFIEDFLEYDMGDGVTPLQYVLKNIQYEPRKVLVSIAKELIIAGANPHKSYIANVKSPIELAIEGNQADLIELMFEHGADPRIRLDHEDTLLHSAVRIDFIDPEIVRILLKNGVDAEAENENLSSVDFATTLADVNDELPRYREKANIITKFISARNKARDEFKRICASKVFDESALNELLKDPDFLVYDIVDGYSPLQYAIACAYTQDEKLSLANPSTAIDVSKSLIRVGASLSRNRTNKSEYSPIALAVRANQPELLKLMLDKGFPANFKSENGNTLLHSAVNHAGDLEIFRLLLDHGADPEIQNKFGQSSLDIASENEVELMKQYIKSSSLESNTESVEENHVSFGPITQILAAMVDEKLKTDMILKLNTNRGDFNNKLKSEMKWTAYKYNTIKAKELHGISEVIKDMFVDKNTEYTCDLKGLSPDVQKALFNIIAYAGKLTLEPESRFKRKNNLTLAKYKTTIDFLKDISSGSVEDLQIKVEEYMKKPEIIKNRGSGLYRVHSIFAKKGSKVQSTMQELFKDLYKVLKDENIEKSKKSFKNEG